MKIAFIAGCALSIAVGGLAWADGESAPSQATGQKTSAASLDLTSAPSLEFQSAPASSSANSGASAPAKAEWNGLKADIKSTETVLAHLSSAERKKWETAVTALPDFCHEWERLLHNREMDNLAHLNWKNRDGYQTANYTGYSKVQACEAKESAQGIPIGKVVYDERNYYLAGKTVEEAKSNAKVVGTTSTLEIFSFEKDRWFY